MLLVRKNNHGILKGKNKALILNFKKGINVELGKKIDSPPGADMESRVSYIPASLPSKSRMCVRAAPK